MSLSLSDADKIVATALKRAGQLNEPISVAVCDTQGHLVTFSRMDGAQSAANRLAYGKAAMSAGSGLPSDQVIGVMEHSSVAAVIAEGISAVRTRGGLPIFKNDELVGGIGIEGAKSHTDDEKIARVALGALNS
jgi:glc operon protein GlcG